MCVLNRQGNLNSHDYTVHYLHCGIESANEWAGGPSTRPGPTVFYDIAQEELSVLPIF